MLYFITGKLFIMFFNQTFFNKKLCRLLLLSSAAVSMPSLATIVEVQVEYQRDAQLVQESFEINLHDEATPATVASRFIYRNG